MSNKIFFRNFEKPRDIKVPYSQSVNTINYPERSLRPAKILLKPIRFLCLTTVDLGLRYTKSKNNKLVSSLHIHSEAFRNILKYKEQCLLHVVLRRLKHLSCLQIVNRRLDINANPGDEFELVRLANNLRNMTSLTTLKLYFTNSAGLTRRSAKHLSQNIQHLSSLTALTLRFLGSRTIDEEIQELSSCSR